MGKQKLQNSNEFPMNWKIMFQNAPCLNGKKKGTGPGLVQTGVAFQDSYNLGG